MPSNTSCKPHCKNIILLNWHVGIKSDQKVFCSRFQNILFFSEDSKISFNTYFNRSRLSFNLDLYIVGDYSSMRERTFAIHECCISIIQNYLPRNKWDMSIMEWLSYFKWLKNYSKISQNKTGIWEFPEFYRHSNQSVGGAPCDLVIVLNIPSLF